MRIMFMSKVVFLPFAIDTCCADVGIFPLLHLSFPLIFTKNAYHIIFGSAWLGSVFNDYMNAGIGFLLQHSVFILAAIRSNVEVLDRALTQYGIEFFRVLNL